MILSSSRSIIFLIGRFLRAALAVCVIVLAVLASAQAQTETALYDGWANDYAAGGNRTVFAPGLARPGTAGVDPFYRFVDGDASTSDVQHFSATGGIEGIPVQYTGPTLYGGSAYRDNERPDDTATFAGTVLAIRNNANDADNGAGVKGDPIRAYVPSDANGLTFDEAFGAILCDYDGGAGLTGMTWSGSTNADTLAATVRWAVLDGSTLYVSNASFSVANNGIASQTNTLPDVTATTWAVWDPGSDIADMKFTSTAPVFAARTFTNVTKVGYVWELSDAVNASNYLDTVRFTVTKQAVAPVITSAATASGNVNLAFSYQIEASDSPTSYGVTGTLPGGLSLDPATGLINGTPTTEEVRTVTISATNAQGTGNAPLEITIGPVLPVPEITSPTAAATTAGGGFSYQVTATNDPTSFSASGLPPGLTLDPATGLISGEVVEAGDYTVTVTASNGAGSQQTDITISVNAYLPPQVPGGRTYRCYFLGNSLTLSLTTAPQPELARLERIFAERGNRLVFGATLGAGVNLDQHWNGQLYDGQYMKQGYFDDQHEYSLDNGWAGPGADFGTTMFRDYNFALQGKRRDYDGTIVDGHVWDALILQPYVNFLEADGYPVDFNTIAPLGDRTAINNFIDYAGGNNPSSFDSVRRFYIYSVWPQLLGVEGAAIDTDGNGVFSFSEFYDQPYNPPVNPAIFEQPREHVPSRAFLTALHDAVRTDNPARADRIFIIPVGEVFAELDRLIRTDALPGIEAHHDRMAAYYLNARLNELPNLADANFIFIYPPNQPGNFGNAFIREQGIKNFYADNIHWNNQTHNDPDSGTFGAYVAAATVHAVITGENPGKVSAEAVAAYYEAFDAVEDAALIAKVQEVIWQVITSTNWHGVNYAERTGVGTPPAAAASYRDFAEAHFSPAQLADPAVSGESADPEGDGNANIIEFFGNGNPLAPDRPVRLELAPDGTQTVVSLTGLSRPTGASPVLEVSQDLQTWERLGLRDFITTPGAGADGSDMYSLNVETPGDRNFFRLALPYIPDSESLPLVVWGASSDMLTTRQNAATGVGSTTVDLSTPANPSVGAGGYNTFNPILFASGVATGPANTFDLFWFQDHSNPEDGTGDHILLKWTADAGTDNAGTFTAIWKQDGDGATGGFLNGADTGDVHLANMEVFPKVGFGTGSVSQMRFVIQKDGAWYVSDDCGAVSSVKLTGPNDAPYERVALANPHGVEWFEFDPTTNMTAIGAPVALADFNGITAVGFHWRTSGIQSLRYLYIEKFQANFYP